MDDQFFLLTLLEKWTGIGAATWVLVFLGLVQVCNFVTRLIPDDETGWLKQVKRVTRIIGLYTSNRVSKGVTVNDIAKSTVDVVPEIAQAAESKPVIEEAFDISKALAKKGRPDVPASW